MPTNHGTFIIPAASDTRRRPPPPAITSPAAWTHLDELILRQAMPLIHEWITLIDDPHIWEIVVNHISKSNPTWPHPPHECELRGRDYLASVMRFNRDNEADAQPLTDTCVDAVSGGGDGHHREL